MRSQSGHNLRDSTTTTTGIYVYYIKERGGKKRPWEKKITSLLCKKEDSKTFLFKTGIQFFKGKIPAYKPQGGATIPCLQILNF